MDRRKSAIDYKSDGSKKVFNIPFVFLDRKELKVYQQDKELEFDFISDGKIILKEPVEKGKYISFRRETLNYELKHSYKYNEVLKSKNINDNKLTIFHSLEEFSDLGSYVLTSTTEDIYKDIEFNLNATIINVKDPENDNELLNLRTVNNVILSDLTNQYNIIDFENMLYDYINNNLINSFNILYWENKIKNDIRTIDYSIISEQEDVITETFEYLNIQPFRDTHVTPYINEISNYTWKTFEDYKIEIDEEFLKPEYIFDKEYYSQEVYDKFNYSNELNIGDTILSSRDERNTETVNGINKWIKRNEFKSILDADYPVLKNYYPKTPDFYNETIFRYNNPNELFNSGEGSYNNIDDNFYFIDKDNKQIIDFYGNVISSYSFTETTSSNISVIIRYQKRGNHFLFTYRNEDLNEDRWYLVYSDISNIDNFTECNISGKTFRQYFEDLFNDNYQNISISLNLDNGYFDGKYYYFILVEGEIYILHSINGIDFTIKSLGFGSFQILDNYFIGNHEIEIRNNFLSGSYFIKENNKYILKNNYYHIRRNSSTSGRFRIVKELTFDTSFNLLSMSNPPFNIENTDAMDTIINYFSGSNPYSATLRIENIRNNISSDGKNIITRIKTTFSSSSTEYVIISNDSGNSWKRYRIDDNTLNDKVFEDTGFLIGNTANKGFTSFIDDRVYLSVDNSDFFYYDFETDTFRHSINTIGGLTTSIRRNEQPIILNKNLKQVELRNQYISYEYTKQNNMSFDMPAIPNPNNKTNYYTKGL